MNRKPIHAKPSLYAVYFHELKEIAEKYGYNLVIHGSLNRDLDLIAIPWQEEIKPHTEMIVEFAKQMGGTLMSESGLYSITNHGRMQYVLNLHRTTGEGEHFRDEEYYLDISVIPIGVVDNFII